MEWIESLVDKIRNDPKYEERYKAAEMLERVFYQSPEIAIDGLYDATRDSDMILKKKALRGLATAAKYGSGPAKLMGQKKYYQAVGELSADDRGNLREFFSEISNDDFCAFSRDHNAFCYDSDDTHPSGHIKLYMQCGICNAKWTEWNDE